MSWEQLVAITKEARQIAADERSRPPVACPSDGQALEYHQAKGLLHCRFCGFTVPGRPAGT